MDFGDDRWWQSDRFWAKAVIVSGVIACGAQAAAMVGLLAKEPAKNLENAHKTVISESLKKHQHKMEVNTSSISKEKLHLLINEARLGIQKN